MDSDVLKSGYTSRDLIILENDDPGGIFEFSYDSRGPYVIKVGPKLHSGFITSESVLEEIELLLVLLLQEGDAVELRIARSRGALVKQFLCFHVEPRDSNEFYGNTGVLEFSPGEREVVITLLTRLDGMPEVPGSGLLPCPFERLTVSGF